MHDDGMSERPRAGVMFINVAADSSSQALRRKLNQDESKSSDQKRIKLLQNDLFTPVHLLTGDATKGVAYLISRTNRSRDSQIVRPSGRQCLSWMTVTGRASDVLHSGRASPAGHIHVRTYPGVGVR